MSKLALRTCLIAVLLYDYGSGIQRAGAAQQALDSWNDQDLPLVLTATRLKQPKIESPLSISLIDQQMIRDSGARSIPELFRFVPGMQIGYVRGNFPVVAYQGLTSEFPQGVQVLVDGLSVYSPLFGGVLWTNLPLLLEDIERIEIVRGPNGATYGANSLQSVINITTSHAAQDRGHQLKLGFGSQNQKRAFVRTSDSIGALDYRVSVLQESSSGYAQMADDYERKMLTSRFDYQVSPFDQIQFNMSLIDGIRETRDPDRPNYVFDPKRNRKESSQYLHLRWEHNSDSRHSFIHHASYHRYNALDAFLAPIGMGNNIPINAGSESERWDFEFEHLYQWNKKFRLAWGLGAQFDDVYLPLRLNSEQRASNHREQLFSRLEWRIQPELLINLGLLSEYDQLVGPLFSPHLGITHLLSPEHSLRFSVSRAYRSPVQAEENRLTIVNGFVIQSSAGGLQPEQVNNYEAGYHGLMLNQQWELDIKLFHNRYKRLLDNSIDGLLLIENQHRATVNGLELETSYRSPLGVLLHANYTFNQIDADQPRHEASIPRHAFSILAARSLSPEWRGSIAYHYVGSMQFLGNANQPQGSYRRLDLNMAHQSPASDLSAVELNLSLQLALDKNRDFHTRAHFDNRVFIELGFNFD